MCGAFLDWPVLSDLPGVCYSAGFQHLGQPWGQSQLRGTVSPAACRCGRFLTPHPRAPTRTVSKTVSLHLALSAERGPQRASRKDRMG